MSTLTSLYGGLASTSWTPLFEVALASRRQLGLEACEAELIGAILLSHRKPGRWESIAQQTLATRRDVDRTTLNRQIGSLRNKGMLAVREDEAHRPSPTKHAPYFYCPDPYLAALTKLAAERSDDAAIQAQLQGEAHERFSRFVNEVRQGRWDWKLDGVGSSSANEVELIIQVFAERHRLNLPSEG